MTETHVSVIVPVYNDPDGVTSTIESVHPQLTDGDELLVVDNNSTDRTPEVIRTCSRESPGIDLLHETEIQSSYAARNTGIRASSGDILAFIDADMTVEPTWLADLRSYFSGSDADYVGCNVELYIPAGSETSIAQYNVAKGFPVEYYIREKGYAPTCCLSVRRTVVRDVGRFDASLVSGGDGEFGRRVADAGYTQEFASEITMYHPARTTLSELGSKAVRIGRGQEQLYRSGTRDSRPLLNPRNFLPPHPGTFRRTVSGNWGLPTLAGWFLLAYWFKLMQVRGRIRERLNGRGETPTDGENHPQGR
ncbi:glycosyltransferase [Haloarchaeobius sp. HRN-SO-5]|uniref:glycosyltransferase n=1 Tax=Haloarchaeobius sp. HRN-SO-5 TaxID=3446118 RepID=UPI003EBCE831